MSEVAIKIENLGKKYIIGHQKAGDLRSSFSNKLKDLFGGTNGIAEEFWALRDINFEVKQGEAVGIIGRNGAGKSTLLKILSRITDPTTGRFEINGRVSSLLEVGTGFHQELTGRENIFLNGTILGMKRSEIRSKFDQIVDFSGVEKFLDTPVKHYSSGMKVRLAFSVAAHLEPEILIVDEVLAVGDSEFQKKCLGKMDEVSKREGRTILFVSHNMGAISRLCKSALYLIEGKVELVGSVNTVIRNYSVHAKKSSNSFNHEIVKEINVATINEFLVIELRFINFPGVRPPFLGFIVSSQEGFPIFGSNPKIAGQQSTLNFKKEGRVKVFIRKPKLLRGNYSLSVFFGDGNEDFFVAPDTLEFSIDDNNEISKLPDPLKIGPVIPEVEWEISSL